MGNKICKDCGKELPIEEFYSFYDKRVNLTTYFARCKKCENEHRKILQKINRTIPKKRNITSNTEELERINKEAWEAGMSYGQYVAMQAQKREKELKEKGIL